MKLSIATAQKIKTIEIIEYNTSEYKELISILKSFGGLYPWYYHENNNQHFLIHYGGNLNSQENYFKNEEWQVNKTIGE